MRYDYQCPACGNAITIYRSIHDIEVEYDCPNQECGSTLKREWSAPSIQFKGSGFYSTDHNK